MPKKTLRVLTRVEPSFVTLNPICVGFCLRAYYYDDEWSPEDGFMFANRYPGTSLGWGLWALKEAEKYAKEEGYDRIVIERFRGEKTEMVYSRAVI